MPNPPIPRPPEGNSNPNDNLYAQPPKPIDLSYQRVDFDEGRYETLIAQKGVDLLVEKALQCPCKTASINQLSTCRNCGGTGWVFVNPRRTRLVVQGMGIKKIEEVWTSLMKGIIRVSFPPYEDLAHMDRITRLNANSVFAETFQLTEANNKVFGFITYQPKEIEYIGLYQNDTEPFLQLTTAQFTVTNNRIDLIGVDLDAFEIDANNPLTATIRYVHAPTFNVIDVDREPLDNYKWTGTGEQLQELPGKALAQRTHNLEDLVKLRQGKLLNNNYNELHCTC
jgi:hypothetical protein